MELQGKTQLHYGVGCMVTPVNLVDSDRRRHFEQKMAAGGVEFDRWEAPPNGFVFTRTKNDKVLEVRVVAAGPQVAQLVLVSPNPAAPYGVFAREAEMACRALQEVWPGVRTVVHREVTMRQLYNVEGEHAFRFLWEKRLGQSAEHLKVFGRPVLGGGLRLVIPPTNDHPCQLDIKVESFLRDSAKLFVEVQAKWSSPVPVSEGMVPGDLLDEVDRVIDTQVTKFVRASS